MRARRLEKALGTPAHIYYKYEARLAGWQPQAQHRHCAGLLQQDRRHKALTTETGAGQWGSALAMACKFFDMDLEVYMVKVSYDQKPYRRIPDGRPLGRRFLPARPTAPTPGARCWPGPRQPRLTGDRDLRSGGSRGHVSGGTKKYSLGSVLNHVLLHQTVIGEEALKQMDMAGEYPDVVIGCVGGGSNFGGIAYPFLRENLKNGQRTRLVAVEPTATPSLTKGIYTFDYGDTAQMAPIVKMHTLGHDLHPAAIHAGGLRYHGMAPACARCMTPGLIEAWPCRRWRPSRRRCSLPAPKASSRPPNRPCHPRRHRRGPGCQGQRREARDPVQPVGAWQFRYGPGGRSRA
jgi:tryptophan synthase beta chain